MNKFPNILPRIHPETVSDERKRLSKARLNGTRGNGRESTNVPENGSTENGLLLLLLLPYCGVLLTQRTVCNACLASLEIQGCMCVCEYFFHLRLSKLFHRLLCLFWQRMCTEELSSELLALYSVLIFASSNGFPRDRACVGAGSNGYTERSHEKHEHWGIWCLPLISSDSFCKQFAVCFELD